jgi:hypothetical protein
MSTPPAPETPGDHHAHGEVANPKALIITFLALTFGVVFVVLVLAVYHNAYTSRLKATNQEGWTADARETFTIRSGAMSHLQTYGAVDGSFHIPVDVAADLVVAEYAQVGSRPESGGQMGAADGFSLNTENDVAYADDKDEVMTNTPDEAPASPSGDL